jgi:hypothetical protein
MADGFHIDGDGNLWIGSASTNFDNNAAFYVKTDGEMKATSGEIGGLDIESNRIKSNSYSNTNEEGFQIHSDGTAKFYGSLTANTLSATGANISGNITATDGTIGGTQINSSNIESTEFDSNTGYQIGANSATFHDVTVTGTISGANIDGTISGSLATANSGTRIDLSSDSNAGFIRFFTTNQQTGTIGSNTDGLSIDAGTAQYITLSSATGIKSFGPWYYWDGSAYTTGSSGKVVVSDSNGNPSWGNVPANAGVTSIVTTPGNHITASNNTGTVNLVVNASNLGDSHNHTTTNAPGGTFTDDNHGNNHGLDTSNVLNSSSSGGGTHHSHTTSTVNAISTAGSSVLNLSANTGSILINHLNTDHSGVFANSGHGHNEFVQNANHSHSGFLTSMPSHGHGNSYLSNSHENGHPTNHNHPYASSSHNHNLGEVSGHGNHSHNHDGTYAAAYHNHGNTGINPFTHDDRLLNINANTVPGLNVVQRMNPVTANFSAGYLESVQGAAHHLDSYDKLSTKTYRLTHQDVVQALTDDGIDPDDVAMIVPEVRYAKEHAAELNGDEMKGLMDGEIDAILVQAIKDLSAKIDLLEDRIATLEG